MRLINNDPYIASKLLNRREVYVNVEIYPMCTIPLIPGFNLSRRDKERTDISVGFRQGKWTLKEISDIYYTVRFVQKQQRRLSQRDICQMQVHYGPYSVSGQFSD